MPENPTSMPEPSGENTAEVVAGKNDANVPETPAEPLGGVFVYPGDDDLAGIPVPPIASPGGRPVYPEMTTRWNPDDTGRAVWRTPRLSRQYHRAPGLSDDFFSGHIPDGLRRELLQQSPVFKCQHIRPYSGCLYRWPEYLFRFRVCHDLFLYPRDGRISHRHRAQDQRSDLLSADDCLCVR